MSYEIKVVSLQRRSDRRTYMTELFDGKKSFKDYFGKTVEFTDLDDLTAAEIEKYTQDKLKDNDDTGNSNK